MTSRHHTRAPILAGLALATGLAAPAVAPSALAQEMKLPNLAVFATIRPGTSLNAMTVGMAKLYSEKTGKKMRVRVASGSVDSLVGPGRVDLGVSTSVNGADAFMGRDQFKGRPQKNLRIALPGPTLLIGYIATKDSGIMTIADLKKKRVPGKFPKTRPFLSDSIALLASGGLTFAGVDEIPVSGIRENFQAFLEDRVDAAIMSVGSGLVRQADAKRGGVRFVSLPSGDGVQAILDKVKAGYYTRALKKGYNVGIDRDMTIMAKDIYVSANVKTSEALVYTLAKLMFENMASLHGAHPVFKQWTKANLLQAKVTVPYHAGFVKYLKDTNQWTAQHEATQKALLAAAK